MKTFLPDITLNEKDSLNVALSGLSVSLVSCCEFAKADYCFIIARATFNLLPVSSLPINQSQEAAMFLALSE